MATSHRLLSGLLERLEKFTGFKTFKQIPSPFGKLIVLNSDFLYTVVRTHEK